MRRGKKGFTLIELIVVLVIMAVLAAAAIPTMMGYVEKAQGAQHAAEARSIYVAATAAYTEAYAVYGSTPENAQVDFRQGQTYPEPANADMLIAKRVYEMCIAGIPGGEKAAEAVITGTTTGSVTKVEYHTAFPFGGKRWYVTIEIKPDGGNTATWEKK